VWLFLFFQALYALTSSGNAFRVPDEFEVYFQAEHVADGGDLSIPQTLSLKQPAIVNGRAAGLQPIFFGEIGRDGKPYAPYGPLTAFLILPHHEIARLIASAAGVPRTPLPRGVTWVFLVGGLTALSSGTAAALSILGFRRAAQALGATPGRALLWSLLLGGTTVLWPYATTLYSEAWQAAALIWAAALLLDARSDPNGARWRTGVAAALLALAGLTKVTSLAFAPGFFVAALVDRSRALPSRVGTAALLALGVGAALAIHLAWNVHRFGYPLDFGYNWSETIPDPPPRPFLLADIPRGLLVLLASPGKSLFAWAPVLLLSTSRGREFWNRDRTVALGVATTAAAAFLTFAAYQFPEGGYCHGPRNLVPMLPLLLLPAATTGRGFSRRALAACAVPGALIAVLATSVSFLEDQSIGGDLGIGARTWYYERTQPPPGRPWNRYHLGYIPFVASLTSPGWTTAKELGRGPDYLPLHLLQVRRSIPDGASIPLGLVCILPLFWTALLVVASSKLASLLSSLPIPTTSRLARSAP
jgi:hypothetical protein